MSGSAHLLQNNKLNLLQSLQILNVSLIFKLFQGEHPKHPSIEYFQTKSLSVLPTEQTAGIAIDYDGEILEEGLPVDISIVPEALNLIILRTTN